MKLTETLQKWFGNNQTGEEKTNLVLDDETAIIRYFNMPKMKPKELLESVKWELQDELEFGMDDYIIRAVYLEDSDRTHNVMAVAVLAEKFENIVTQAKDSGLKIGSIELKQASEQSSEKINLYTREKEYQEFLKKLCGDDAVCALAAVIACVWVFQLGYYLHLNNEINTIKQNIGHIAIVKNEYETAMKNNQVIKKRMAELKSIKNEKLKWSEMLTDLEALIPNDCTVYEIRNNKNIVEIFAKTYDLNNAFLVCELLRDNQNFKNVELVSAKQESSGIISEFILKIELEG